MIIDAHQHFWEYEPNAFDWIDDSMSDIRRSFLPADMEPVLNENAVNGTVLIQVQQNRQENDFLLSLAHENSFIKGVVGWVDLQAEDILTQLAALQPKTKLKGFRHIVQGEADEHFMQRKNFERGISVLEKFGFTYDILILPNQLASATVMAKRFPYQRFVLDHLAKPYIKNGLIEEWEKDLIILATCENVSCKISGMVTEADQKEWKRADFRPYIDAAIEAFGTRRVMFGSDWPVCLVASGYTGVLQIVKEYFNTFSSEEQDDFFSRNAIKFYNF